MHFYMHDDLDHLNVLIYLFTHVMCYIITYIVLWVGNILWGEIFAHIITPCYISVWLEVGVA